MVCHKEEQQKVEEKEEERNNKKERKKERRKERKNEDKTRKRERVILVYRISTTIWNHSGRLERRAGSRKISFATLDIDYRLSVGDYLILITGTREERREKGRERGGGEGMRATGGWRIVRLSA